MQPSDQQLPEETVERSSEDKIEPAAQPLYEFPGDELLPNTTAVPAPITRVLPDEELAHMPLEEAVRRGLIYPPPPAFYQNMHEVPVQPPLPSQYGVNEQAAPRFGSVLAPQPPFTPSTTPARRSRRWIWIVVSILSLAFLGSCGSCIWASYAYISPVAQQLSGAIDVVDDYYGNIQAQNYATAYLDLSLNGQLTQDQFVQLAQTRDAQDGRVKSYMLGQPAYGSNPTSGLDLSHLTITVNVTRCKDGASSGQSCLSYTTLLTMQKVAGHWKIVDFYKI